VARSGKEGSRTYLDCRIPIDRVRAIAQAAGEAQALPGLMTSALTEHSRKTGQPESVRDYCTWRWPKSRLGSTVGEPSGLHI
jgi:hypothetical protein